MPKPMRKLMLMLSVLLAAIILAACSGSKDIQGTWKVQDANGENYKLVLKEKTISVDGDAYAYTQNGLGTKNGLTYYLIKLTDSDEAYTIAFPEKDKNTAIMIAPNDTEEPLIGVMVYAMHKKKAPDYQAYADKYIK